MVVDAMSEPQLDNPDLRVLAIDTSQRQGGIATLLDDASGTRTIAHALLPTQRRTAQTMLPALGSLLAGCGWKPQDLGLICVSTGPGSFTGLRIGITCAKTIAYATGATLVGVNTLAAIATQIQQPYSAAWAVLDAQREELFVAQFPKGWEAAEDFVPRTEVMGQADWAAQLQSGEVVAGPPLDSLAELLPEGVILAKPNSWSPSAEAVGRIGVRKFQHGLAIDPIQLVPNYFRKSAAEEKADSAS